MSKPIEGRDHSEFEHGEEIRQEKPFRHSIRVRWGDCDPAKIAYTPNIPAWAIQAIEEWWKHHAGVDWYEINLDHHVGTPFVHMKMDFRSPVTPRHMLDCDVRMTLLGTRSITHEVKAFQDGVLCFEGEFVAVIVDTERLRSRTPPADILAAIKKSVLES